MMIEQEIRTELRKWVLERVGEKDKRDFDDSSPLLTEGLLSSLDVVEFILFIESLRGDEVDAEALQPEVFTSIDTVFGAFFPQAAA